MRNLTSAEIQLHTNGQLTATVVAPGSGEAAGAFIGIQAQPLIIVRVASRASQRVPLLIGTASVVPGLGYAVPPGEWAVHTTLQFADGRRRRTPPLPLTVTE